MGNAQSSRRPRRLTPQEVDKTKINTYTDLAAANIGGRVVALSDEFFSEADNLLKPSPPSKEITHTENGIQRDGWETRRHSRGHDYVIIRLGFPGNLAGFDIDTSNFKGDHAPFAAVDACYVGDDAVRKNGPGAVTSYQWEELLPKIVMEPSTHNVFSLPLDLVDATYDHVRLRIYPDGGVARFRVFGSVVPVWGPNISDQLVDLAYIGNGGRVVSSSDEYFAPMSNLILPGRGNNTRDGWLTRRGWSKHSKEWAVIHLGATAVLEKCEIDTAGYRGNHPEDVLIEGCYSMEERPEDDVDIAWVTLLPRTRVGANAQHFFNFEESAASQYRFTHVRVSVFPDGGLSRVRIYGRVAADAVEPLPAPISSTKSTTKSRSGTPQPSRSPSRASLSGRSTPAASSSARPRSSTAGARKNHPLAQSSSASSAEDSTESDDVAGSAPPSSTGRKRGRPSRSQSGTKLIATEVAVVRSPSSRTLTSGDAGESARASKRSRQ